MKIPPRKLLWIAFIVAVLILIVSLLPRSGDKVSHDGASAASATARGFPTPDPRPQAQDAKSDTPAYPSPQFIEKLRNTALENLGNALGIIDKEVPLIERPTARFDLMNWLCLKDPRFLAQAEQTLNKQQCKVLFESLARTWAKGEVDLNALASGIGTLQNEDLRLLLWNKMVVASAWGGTFDRARFCLDQMPPSSSRTDGVAKLAGPLSIKDPGKALEWFKTLTDEREVSAAQQELRHVFAAKKDLESLVWLSENVKTDAQRLTWISIGQVVGASGDDSAFLKYKKIAAEQGNALLLGFISSAPLSKVSGLVSEAMTSKDEQFSSDAARAYIQRLTDADMPAAEAWVLGSPDRMHERLLDVLIRVMYQKDKAATIAWVESLADGSDRDMALNNASGIVGRADREKGKRLAMKIGDPKTRALALKYLEDY